MTADFAANYRANLRDRTLGSELDELCNAWGVSGLDSDTAESAIAAPSPPIPRGYTIRLNHSNESIAETSSRIAAAATTSALISVSFFSSTSLAFNP